MQLVLALMEKEGTVYWLNKQGWSPSVRESLVYQLLMSRDPAGN